MIIIFIMSKVFVSCFPDCTTLIEPFQTYDLLGLYFGVGRTFFNPASVSINRVSMFLDM